MKIQIINEASKLLSSPKAKGTNKLIKLSTGNIKKDESYLYSNGLNIFKKVYKKLFKTPDLEISKRPIISELETDTDYPNAEAKLSDLLLENIKNNSYPISTIQHNLNEIQQLPQYIVDHIPASYVSPTTAHIDNDAVKKIIDAAKKAGKVSNVGEPNFWGHLNAPNASDHIDALHYDFTKEIVPSNVSDKIDFADSKYKIFNNIDSHIDNGIDKISDAASHMHDVMIDKASSIINLDGLDKCDGLWDKIEYIIDQINPLS